MYVYSNYPVDFNRRILGDATGEMGPFGNIRYNTKEQTVGAWYADEAWYVSYIAPWFVRGGYFNSGKGSGIFAFGNSEGKSSHSSGYRIVLAS